MAVYSYLRVSTEEQTVENQRLHILSNGFAVDEWFQDDGVSGTKAAMTRKGFLQMMSRLKQGDTCICTEVSRLGRNTADVLSVIQKFKEMGVKLRILQLAGVDLTDAAGELIVSVMAAISSFERSTLINRTNMGLSRAKSQGTILGAKFKVPPTTLQQAHKWICEKVPHIDIANKLGVSSATLSVLKKNWMCSNEKMEEYKQRYEAQQSQLKGKSYE